MTPTPALRQHVRVDPLSVVPNQQPELPPLIEDLHMDLPGLGVYELIPYRLASDPVYVVPYHRRKIPGSASHIEAKLRTIPAAPLRDQFFRDDPDRPCQIV